MTEQQKQISARHYGRGIIYCNPSVRLSDLTLQWGTIQALERLGVADVMDEVQVGEVFLAALEGGDRDALRRLVSCGAGVEEARAEEVIRTASPRALFDLRAQLVLAGIRMHKEFREDYPELAAVVTGHEFVDPPLLPGPDSVPAGQPEEPSSSSG